VRNVRFPFFLLVPLGDSTFPYKTRLFQQTFGYWCNNNRIKSCSTIDNTVAYWDYSIDKLSKSRCCFFPYKLFFCCRKCS
jgi:hypothetical protein